MTGVARRAIVAVAVVLIAVGAVAGGASGQTMDGMTMVGDPHEYPDLARAGHKNVERARKLAQDSRRAAPRFATMARARRLGYHSTKFLRPGFTHFRQGGPHFSGKVLDPTAPQALLFWCPSSGGCTLAAFMYRSRPGAPPSTWGDMLMWHRHGTTPTASWMTHVWLVRHVRPAFATCAPMSALKADLGIQPETPYRGIAEAQPCKTDPTSADQARAATSSQRPDV